MVTGAPIKILAILVGIFTAIGAAFGAMNTMYAQVAARTREIGTLRAIGFSRRAVLASFILEALLLCLIGGVIGTAAAFVLFNLLLTKPTGTMNFRTFSEVLFNFRLTPPLMIGGLVFSLAMGLLGGFFPAARAARLKIINALREIYPGILRNQTRWWRRRRRRLAGRSNAPPQCARKALMKPRCSLGSTATVERAIAADRAMWYPSERDAAARR